MKKQYTLYCSAIYPILVSNIPYIGLQYTLYCFAAPLPQKGRRTLIRPRLHRGAVIVFMSYTLSYLHKKKKFSFKMFAGLWKKL